MWREHLRSHHLPMAPPAQTAQVVGVHINYINLNSLLSELRDRQYTAPSDEEMSGCLLWKCI